MGRARRASILAGAGFLLLAGLGAAQAQAAEACDTLPAVEIADREWVSRDHREAVAALALPSGPERAGALAAANEAMGFLAGEIESSHGRGATLAMVRADWAMIAREADRQTYGAPAAAELRHSFAVLLEAAHTRAEADYLLHLTRAAEVTPAEIADAVGRHRAVAGDQLVQLAAIADYVGRMRPPAQEVVELSRLMRTIAAELQSARGIYEADAMLLPALIETGGQDEAEALAAALAPDAIARLERTSARLEAGAGGAFGMDCWLAGAVMAHINEALDRDAIDSKQIEPDAGGKPLHTFPHPALAGAADHARLQELLFWEGIEIALSADTETDYTGASVGFAQLLALKSLDDTRYRKLLRSFALANPHANMAYAGEVGMALSGGEIFASMLYPEIAADFYGDAKRWSGAGSDTPAPIRFEVLLRALRFEWIAGNSSSVDDTMAEARALIDGHGAGIDPILRTLYHLLEAEIMEARLEDRAAAEALARDRHQPGGSRRSLHGP